MAKEELYPYISKDLRALAYPIEDLELLPGNNRRGDVDAVAKSLERFGQRKPIVARKKTKTGKIGIVLAGNTTLQGMRKNGCTHIAVSWEEDDDKTAAAFAIADNRTHDLGTYDDQLTIEMIQKFEDDTDLLEASGYDLVDVQDMIDRITGDDSPEIFDLDDDKDEGPAERPRQGVVIQYAIIFDNEEQQQRWFAFVRQLKKDYPDRDTLAGRLDDFLQSLDGND